MARKKIKDRHIRKISLIGNRSLGITLPAEFLAELGWRKKQKVVVRKDKRKLIISDWKK